MELSIRLQAVADLVTPGMRLADVGTDHAYIPIYLVEQGRIPLAIAMDIGKGPLERATEHIREYGLTDQIRTCLSDGLKNLKKEEADAMIAAGMGGGLVIKILSDSRDTALQLKELILQPQSEIGKVREYLVTNGYRIVAENMVLDDGKYYPMMKVLPVSGAAEESLADAGSDAPYLPEELEFGRILLRERNPVLKQFLEREIAVSHTILDALEKQDSERALKRKEEIRARIKSIEDTLCKYFTCGA